MSLPETLPSYWKGHAYSHSFKFLLSVKWEYLSTLSGTRGKLDNLIDWFIANRRYCLVPFGFGHATWMPIRRTGATHAHAASYDACAHVVLRYHSGGSHNVSILERHWNSWSKNCGGLKRWPVVCSRGKCSRPNPSPYYSLPACYTIIKLETLYSYNSYKYQLTNSPNNHLLMLN